MSALECRKVTICGLAYCQGLTLNNLACDKELWSVLLDFSNESLCLDNVCQRSTLQQLVHLRLANNLLSPM